MFAKQILAKLLLLFWGAGCSGFVAENGGYGVPPGSKRPMILSRCDRSSEIVALDAARRELLDSTRPAQERTVVIMYHKPPDVITSHSNADETSRSSDHGNRRTVYEDIYGMKGFVSDAIGDSHGSFEEATRMTSKLHAIGRLDADTTGLLLLTNDGALVHKVTNPNAKIDGLSTSDKNPIQKTYEALIMGHHSLPASSRKSTFAGSNLNASNNTGTEDYPLQMLLDQGVELSAKHGGHTKPVDALSVLSHPSRSTTRVSVTISEGKNRQIRRMFHAVGSGVMKLHRVSVGGLTLNGLSNSNGASPGESGSGSGVAERGLREGEWRLLTENEIREGLGWKCRYLDDARNEKKKMKDSPDQRRRKSNQRRRNVARGKMKGRHR